MKILNLILILVQYIKAFGIVCSEDELVRELREDISDNGMLDCLRQPKPASNNETHEQRATRLASGWNSDCAFEAEDQQGKPTWFDSLKKYYGISYLIDVEGQKYADPEQDQSDQADLCEIVRTMIGQKKFDLQGSNPLSFGQLNYDFLDQIECVGDEGQTKVCAMTSGSFAEKTKWHILLEPSFIQISSKLEFELVIKQG